MRGKSDDLIFSRSVALELGLMESIVYRQLQEMWLDSEELEPLLVYAESELLEKRLPFISCKDLEILVCSLADKRMVQPLLVVGDDRIGVRGIKLLGPMSGRKVKDEAEYLPVFQRRMPAMRCCDL